MAALNYLRPFNYLRPLKSAVVNEATTVTVKSYDWVQKCLCSW